MSSYRSGKANSGHALETIVLVELDRQRCQIAYVKTPSGQEVDFVAKTQDGKAVYIQVCSDLSSPDVCQRELQPLNDILAAKTKPSCLLLTLTATDAAIAQKNAPAEVSVKPVWEWLLERR